MATVLGPRLPMSHAAVPPGMSVQDNLIWQRWRPLIANDFTGFYANVRVGEGQQPLAEMDEASRTLLGQLTQHRIDLILVATDKIWLVEVRNNAGSGALGTILTNSTLYDKDPILGRLYNKVILTNDMDDDSRSAAEAAGVLIIVA